MINQAITKSTPKQTLKCRKIEFWSALLDADFAAKKYLAAKFASRSADYPWP